SDVRLSPRLRRVILTAASRGGHRGSSDRLSVSGIERGSFKQQGLPLERPLTVCYVATKMIANVIFHIDDVALVLVLGYNPSERIGNGLGAFMTLETPVVDCREKCQYGIDGIFMAGMLLLGIGCLSFEVLIFSTEFTYRNSYDLFLV